MSLTRAQKKYWTNRYMWERASYIRWISARPSKYRLFSYLRWMRQKPTWLKKAEK